MRVDGGGAARVVSSPTGIDCASGTCSAQFPLGSAVTLTADHGASRFVRWRGAASGVATDVVVSLGSDASVTAVFASANYVFVTSSALDPATLTPVGADAECAVRARLAGLPGTYRAWVSSASAPAAARLDAGRGWVRTDGFPFADTLADLLAGRIFYPPRLDEFGQPSQAIGVRTLTTPDGSFSTSNCLSGAGTEIVGSSSGGPGTWTSAGQTSDCVALPIYCFGVDLATAVTVTRATGRSAFVSGAAFSPGGGITAADGVCATDATANGLPGTYLALLASASAPATARFDLAGAPWVRLDGVPVVRRASDIAAPGELLAPISVGPDGSYLAGGEMGARAWSGTWMNLWDPGTVASTCGDWTQAASGPPFPSTYGDVGETNARYYAMGPSDCSLARHLYCLQQ